LVCKTFWLKPKGALDRTFFPFLKINKQIQYKIRNPLTTGLTRRDLFAILQTLSVCRR
jgi:hypothetical protein